MGFLSTVNIVQRATWTNVNGLDPVLLLAFTPFKCKRNQALLRLKVEVPPKLDLRDTVSTFSPCPTKQILDGI